MEAMNLLKSKISVIDFATGLLAATENIKLNGAVIPVQPPQKALKSHAAIINDISSSV